MYGLLEGGESAVGTNGAHEIDVAVGQRLATNGARVSLVDVDPMHADAAAKKLSDSTKRTAFPASEHSSCVTGGVVIEVGGAGGRYM